MPIIKTEKLCFSYGINTEFENKALDNINLDIKKGEFVGIIGHTGSGKSTLVSHLNGLLKPTEGTVYFNGKNIWQEAKKIRNIRFRVGMVFQYPEYQLFEETVYKDIAFGPHNMGCSDDDIDLRVKEVAKLVDIDETMLEKSPFELSGGEKRRCAIAGVMAMQPDVLLLDEPTAGLDPYGRKKLLSIIENYHSKKKNTVILVSHSMEEIAQVCEKVIVIDNAKVAMCDTAKKIFAREKALSSIGLNLPQITYIISRLKEAGIDLPDGILTVEEAADAIESVYKRRYEQDV